MADPNQLSTALSIVGQLGSVGLACLVAWWLTGVHKERLQSQEKVFAETQAKMIESQNARDEMNRKLAEANIAVLHSLDKSIMSLTKEVSELRAQVKDFGGPN